MKVAFVLPNVSRNAAEQGKALSVEDIAALTTISNHAGVEASVLLACEDRETWGKPKPSMKAMVAERPRLLAAIAATGAELVIGFGTNAAKALFGKGNVTLKDLKHHVQLIDGIAPPVWFTHSLEEIAMKTGLLKVAGFDVLRACKGDIPTVWGDYYVGREPHDELRALFEPIWFYDNTVIIPDLAKLEPGAVIAVDDPWAIQIVQPNAPVKWLDGRCTIAMDLETYPGLDPYAPDARIRMVVLSHRAGFAQVVPLPADSSVPDWVRNILENEDIVKTGSNIQFDVRWLRRFGVTVRNFVDTSYMEHLIDENQGVKDLKTLVLKYHETLGDYARGHQKLVEERGGWEYVRDEEMLQYAGGDGDGSIAVAAKQFGIIVRDGLQRPAELMKRVHETIAWLSHNGACVDRGVNAQLDADYTAESSRLQASIREVLGPINLASPKQLAKALQYKVPDINLKKAFTKREDEDHASTAAAVLRREAAKDPVIADVLQWRRLTTLHKFVKGLPEHMRDVGGSTYVFSRLRGDVTVTYRHSSAEPNLQNVPKSGKETDAPHLNVKRQYVSRFEGGLIGEWDESQIELREAGMLSGDRVLAEAFASGQDLHTYLAAMMHGVPIEQVTKSLRDASKTTTFRVLYGGGPFGLSLALGCSYERAVDLIRKFFKTYSGYAEWLQAQRKFVKENLYVESRYGFRRRFIRPTSWDTRAAKHMLRQAGNAPNQNGASYHTNLGIVRVKHDFEARRMRSVPFMTVHDSLAVDIHPDERHFVHEVVKNAMEDPPTREYGVELTIPLVVEGKMGPSWGELEAV